VRIAAGGVGGKPNDLEELAHPPPHPLALHETVHLERLAHDPSHRVPRVERREGILEDHLHPPAQRAQIRVAELGDVLAVEADGSGGRLVQPQKGAPDRRLAAA
jgi:hypothetical protein